MRRRSDRALVFMAKWPEPGAAKTRLSPPLTAAEAASLAKCFLLDTLAAARTCDADRLVAFAPVVAHERFRSLVGEGVGFVAAESASLGGALAEAQQAVLALGYDCVALVGADLPHLPAERYDAAFQALEEADVVLGPCADGGYYLLASRRPTPELFRDVAWSTPAVFAQTLNRADTGGLGVRVLEPCYDVDTVEDLRPLLETLRSRPGAGHTLTMLERLPRLTGTAAASRA